MLLFFPMPHRQQTSRTHTTQTSSSSSDETRGCLLSTGMSLLCFSARGESSLWRRCRQQTFVHRTAEVWPLDTSEEHPCLEGKAIKSKSRESPPPLLPPHPQQTVQTTCAPETPFESRLYHYTRCPLHVVSGLLQGSV